MKRNVLFISAYTGLGGGESVQLNLMGALDPTRFALHLLCPRGGKLPDEARKYGVTVHTLPYRGVSEWFVPALWTRFPASRAIAALAQRLDIHAIHSDYHSLPFAVQAARINAIPVIWNAMGWWFPAKPWQRRFFRDGVTQIIAITQAVRDRWLARSGHFMSPDRIRVITPGVDPDVFSPNAVSGAPVRRKLNLGPDVPLVAMIARFQHVKGHDVFQDMALAVHARRPDVRFVVAGENVFGGSKDEAYKRRVLERAGADPVLRETLTYLGFWLDAREVIAAADVIVCPSRFESLGMVHLESMAMGRPVVSMDNGGPAETVIDGETGYLVPPDDPAALATRVLALLDDPDLRRHMGNAGRMRVLERYTAAGYAQRIADLIETLV